MSKPERNLIHHFRSGLAGLMALALMSTWSLGAEVKMTLLKVGPRTYRRVTVLGVSETDLYFRHANGISNVKLRNLSRELQEQFGYNAQAAEEAERRQMAEDSAYYETVAVDIGIRAQSAAAAAAAESELAAKKAASTEASLADPLSGESLVNRPAPKLEFGSWLGEKPETEGKAVLIFFWATWSTPCRKAIGDMNDLHKKLREQLVVIGWSPQPETALTEFSEVKVEFPLATDAKGALAAAAGVNSVPQAMLIDAKGIVRYAGHPAALTANAVKKLLVVPAE